MNWIGAGRDRRDKIVYLTFDDGPSVTVTPSILRALRDENAKATFFVVGKRIADSKYVDVIRRALRDGHRIENHSLTHADLACCSEQQIREEVEVTSKLLDGFGIKNRLFRPPYGRLDKRGLRIIEDLGLNLAMWNNDPRDWSPESQPGRWVNTALSGIQERDLRVVLCHDIHETTAKHLPILLSRMKHLGYQFAIWEEGVSEIGCLKPRFHESEPTS